MITVKEKISVIKCFPFDVFPDPIKDSMISVAKYYNLPGDYIGAAALFSIASLAGNQYQATAKGPVKPILFSLLIGPSGVGKTPAYNLMCGNIINAQRSVQNDVFKRELKEWIDKKAAAKGGESSFTEPKPTNRIRMIEDVTMEAVSKEAETSVAGFGVYYDEGGRMFTSVNQYKADSSSYDFWNEIWNGKTYQISRVDESRSRFIKSPSVSVLAGMQKERMGKYFNENIISSGFAFRFLMVESDYISIKEDIDYFDELKNEMCEDWQDIIRGLFSGGMHMTKDGEPRPVHFTDEAKKEYTRIMRSIAKEQNVNISTATRDDNTKVALGAKMQAYIARLALILAIIEDYTGPNITVANVHGAYELYKFYKGNAEKIIGALRKQDIVGLTDTEQDLFDALPDMFTAAEAVQVCQNLRLNEKFFLNSFRRKFDQGYIRKLNRGAYEKI